MLPTAATELALRLWFLFLPVLYRIPAPCIGGRTDALLLSYNFNIRSSARPGHPWYDIQGQVNRNKFVSLVCGEKELKPIGALGMKLTETQFWETLKEPLEDLGQEFRNKLLDIKAEIFTKNDSVTMEGTLMCERVAHGHTQGSLQFGFNEQMTYHFDPENRKWTVDHSGDQNVKGMLDSDGELTELLVRIAHGDCRSWLQQVQGPWDEWRQSTVPPTTGHDTAPAPARASTIGPSSRMFPLFLSCAVIIGIHL